MSIDVILDAMWNLGTSIGFGMIDLEWLHQLKKYSGVHLEKAAVASMELWSCVILNQITPKDAPKLLALGVRDIAMNMPPLVSAWCG